MPGETPVVAILPFLFAGDAAEKARMAVTWRIRHAIRKIEAAHPELGRHLANSLRTGTFCTDRPERPVAWQLAPPRDLPPARCGPRRLTRSRAVATKTLSKPCGPM